MRSKSVVVPTAPGVSVRRPMIGVLVGIAVMAAARNGWEAEQKGPAPCRVSGKVIDVSSHKGLSNFQFMLTVDDPESGGDYLRVTTRKDGTFEVKVPKGSLVSAFMWSYGASEYLLDMEWLQGNGHLIVPLGEITKDKGNVVLKVKVRPTTPLTGKVVIRGVPLARATVMMSESTVQTWTDARGVFSFKNAPADKDYELLVLSRDRQYGKLARMKAGTTKTTIALARTITLKGRAIATDGKPAAGLRFYLMPRTGRISFFHAQVSFTTDKRGYYRATGLLPGVEYIATWYDAGDYCAGRATVTAKPHARLTLHPKRFHDDWRTAGNLCIHKNTRCKHLTNFCLDRKDNLLACDAAYSVIRIISPKDERLGIWRLGFAPQAIECRDDGSIVVAGTGHLALLSSTGRVLKQARLPGKAKTATAVAWSGKDIFVCVQRGLGYAIYRLNEELREPTLIIRGLRGCCGQMDFTAKDGILYVAANTRFKVVKYDRDGKKLGSFGQRAAGDKEGFDGCCEPKNVCFDSQGYLYTAESDSRVVRKWTADGTHLGKVGSAEGVRGCVRVTIAVTRDCSKAYMLDTGRNIIRLIRIKPATGAAPDARS